MNINFAPVDEAYIKQKVEDGYYTNATELIRDAIRRMRETDERYNEFVEAVLKGASQIDEGKGVPYTAKLHSQIVQNAKQKAKAGKKPNLDVIPQ
jgi:antitoxin ParD1/3/4